MICLDDGIEDHPKFVGLSDEAFGLWVRCIGYCRRQLTDGYVPEAAARARCRSKNANKTIAELTSGPDPLWLSVPGGYQIQDYVWTGGTRRTWDRGACDRVYERDGHRCRYCGSTERLSIDHVVPRCRGGRDDASNLVVACLTCNSKKGGRTPAEAGLVLLEPS